MSLSSFAFFSCRFCLRLFLGAFFGICFALSLLATGCLLAGTVHPASSTEEAEEVKRFSVGLVWFAGASRGIIDYVVTGTESAAT